jgi:superfamily II DNA or RNA helicase
MRMSAPDVRALHAAIHKACPARAWSRGVLIARDELVEGKSSADDEIVLTVRVPESPTPLTVVLYPETVEWDCGCDSSLDACAHAAAAIIALKKARDDGQELPGASKKRARIRYQFKREGKKVMLHRLLVKPDGTFEPTPKSPREFFEDVDLRVEGLLSAGTVELTHFDQVVRWLTELEDASEIYLEDRKVRTSRKPILPKGTVIGDQRGVVFTVEKNPAIDEIAGAGIVRVGDTLHPIGEVGLAGARLEKLPIERRFTREEFAELALEILPMYERRFEVHIFAKDLPKVAPKIAPRIDLRMEFEQDGVSVAPALVYGDPPRMRVDEKKLIYLQGSVSERDHAEERRLIDELRSNLNLIPGRRVVVRGKDARAFLGKIRGTMAEAASFQTLVPSLRLQNDQFHIDFHTEGDQDNEARRADPFEVLRAYEQGHNLVPLLGGGWAEVPRRFLAEHGARISLLLSMRGEDGKLPLFATAALGELCEALDHPPPMALERLAPLFHGFDKLPDAKLPGDLRAELRPYQKQGVDWLVFLREAGLGGVLADDMGLGKTLQALCAIRGKTLIVCPTSVLPNWANEVVKFRPGLKINLYHGPGRELSDENEMITVTTYALLRNDAELLGKVVWDIAILDEAQAIKNADSLTARAAYALKAKWKLALTGTPIENRLEELWSQIHFTNPGLLLGRTDFSTHFAKPIGAGDTRAAARLRERIKPFILRRLKRDVARDLPPRTDMVLYAELDEKERTIYDAVHFATRQEVVAQLAQGASVLAALEALLRLRQAACHSSLVPGQSAESSSKIAVLLETLTEVIDEGHKALIFSQWTSLLDLLEPELRKSGLDFLRLDGSTTDRGGVVARFQDRAGPPILIISLRAGGTGLNLTAADHVFLFDPWWNPAVEDQAADRAHRIGQERPVFVHRLVARHTVEEKILELQAKKRALADIALGEAAAAAALTREDLLALLE